MKYTYNKLCNIKKLSREISESSVGEFFVSLSSTGSIVTIETSKNLSTGERNTLDSIVENHSLEDLKEVIKNKIIGNIEFGLDLMAEYGAKRTLRGTTPLQTAMVAQKLAGIQGMIMSGSLPTALVMIQLLEPDEDILQEDIGEFVDKIQKYLQQ